MPLTVDLQPEIEARLRAEAVRAGVTLEQLAAQRLMEADLLWRIRTSTPEAETRELHRLLRRSRAERLTEPDRVRLGALLDEREARAARRLPPSARTPSKTLPSRVRIATTANRMIAAPATRPPATRLPSIILAASTGASTFDGARTDLPLSR
jgi:hypothetical protein